MKKKSQITLKEREFFDLLFNFQIDIFAHFIHSLPVRTDQLRGPLSHQLVNQVELLEVDVNQQDYQRYLTIKSSNRLDILALKKIAQSYNAIGTNDKY